jgi:hypothetical protein
MALISYDVAVLIAEHADMQSMAALMLTSRANYQLIRAHERSIVKAKMAKLAHDPMLRPPLGALLSSTAPRQPGLDRNVLEPVSFAVAKELESRERRISSIFSSKSTIEAFNQIFLFQHLPPNQKERLIEGLKDACRMADGIGDCAVSVRLEQKPDSETGHLKDRGWSIEHEIHLARQQYIRSLPPLRLAFLTLLASLAGMQYAQQHQFSLDSDPYRWERITAFKETFLRHGTVVLCALLDTSEGDRSEESARYYTSRVDMVLMELLEYEGVHWGSSRPAEMDDGDARPIPDGLHMTMLQAFQDPEEEEEAEEVGQPLENVDEEEDADGNWLFNIKVFDQDTDDVDEDPSSLMLSKLDPRDALILNWIQERGPNPGHTQSESRLPR